MNRKLIHWFGLTGLLALISYAAAVTFSPLAYPGYNWMAQAVSDLSAEAAPSRMLWEQLAAFYGIGSVVCATCVAIYVSEERLSTSLFRAGIYLFAAMNWVSAVGYNTNLNLNICKHASGFFVIPRRRPAGLLAASQGTSTPVWRKSRRRIV